MNLSKRETKLTQRRSYVFNPSSREVETGIVWLGREKYKAEDNSSVQSEDHSFSLSTVRVALLL